jgi:hypothetical protein
MNSSSISPASYEPAHSAWRDDPRSTAGKLPSARGRRRNDRVDDEFFRPKVGQDDPPSGPGRNAERDFRGEKRSNETHASTTDRNAWLYRKSNGQPSRLCFMGHLLMENRHGLIVDVRTTHATGRAERETAEAMIQAAVRGRRATLGADSAYDAAERIARLRAIGVTPHVAQHRSGRRSAIDVRTTRHPGYAISQRLRKRIEEPFGWIKAAAGLRKTRHRGLRRSAGWSR